LAVKQGIAVERIPATAEKESIPNILKSWKLFDGETINNAAVVLFAKDVRPFYAQCHIKLGRFRGTSRLNDFIDNKDFYGNAFRLYDEANSFIRRHLPIASIFDHDKGERIDRPALPVFAVREALVNAICHCDYSNRSSSITLAIFDDRMEIWNKGLLPKDINLKNLDKKHRSEPHNRAIAKVFYDRKYFEGWGTGISKIFDLCREDRLPDPKYSQDSGGTELTFIFRESIAITYIMEKKQKLTERQNEIIKLLKKTPLNSARLAEKLKNSPTIRTVQTDLIKLEKSGIIRREGKARAMVWMLVL
jgi:ATP-dependent DNA helicase RecG